MNDENLMESLLMAIKGVCDLYMHGSIESNTKEVRDTFNKALCESLSMQADIYECMAQNGWYETEKEDQQHINQVKQKFAA